MADTELQQLAKTDRNPVQETRYQELLKMQGGGGGSASPRLDFVKGLTDQYLGIDAANKVKVDTARGKLIDYYSNLEDPISRFTKFSDQTGLSQQQKLVDNLTRETMTQQDLLDSIPASVVARSGDFLINDADKTAITAREQRPVAENLTKLLRSKQYEEVGLAGKQALVLTLLDLSFKGDAMGAKPLELGVDFTTEDRAIARELFSTILSSQSSAFSGDQDSRDAERRAEEDRAFQKAMQEATFNQQVNMENLSSKNSLANSLALKAASGGGSGGGSSSAPTSSPIYNGKTKAQIKEIEAKTEDAWNKILAGSKTEYDAWKQIDKNQKALGASGVDVRQLWSNHAALAAKVGTGGSIRKTSAEDDF